MEIIASILMVVGVICLYLLIRNNWVCDKRVEAVDKGDYRKLPTYEYMLFKRPFCWDINEFIDDKYVK